MAAPSKQSSRWGSFLQQALDGVESRLDNILVGDGPVEPTNLASSGASTAEAKAENGSSRAVPSTNSTNDRLQERLARAIAAKKYAAQTPDGYSSSNVPSRVGSPATISESSRKSLDDKLIDNEDLQTGRKSVEVQVDDRQNRGALVGANTADPIKGVLSKTAAAEFSRLSMESSLSHAGRQSADFLETRPEEIVLKSEGELSIEESSGGEFGANLVGYEARSRQQRIDLELSDLQRQEEVHGYIERIDALQVKLQYLSRESAESARRGATLASSGTAEKKMAEKDEQIALLMEEGQKLSKTELKHMTIIKKLRAKVAESEKESAESRQKLEKIDKERADLSERLKRIETMERQSTERQKIVTQLQRDVVAITAERDVKESHIADLRARLQDSASQARATEVEAVQDKLAAERRKAAELENDISSLKIEKELAAGRAKTQVEELRATNEREAARARAVEVEMRTEQQMLETRLEIMRTRAEEVSSGSTGDAQAKFLRQIETLQTQYAVASENWQGIEASLVIRIKNLEKERDEALKKESEVRRRAREATFKSKQTKEELEDAQNAMRSIHLELNERNEKLEKLQHRAEEAEIALVETRKAFDREKLLWKAEVQQRVDEDRSRWQEDLRAESPAPSSHKNLTADLLGLQNLQTRVPTRSFTNELTTMEGRMSRKSSAQNARSSGQGTPQRQDSALSIPNGDISELPSNHAGETDDYFDQVLSPSPTHQTMQDVLSVSTVGAGPSVQLVERMSAAVRRLESEKVSTKEELRRLSGQRDEARAQIVNLMQEVESKRAIDLRLKELEDENHQINARYQTTLEMLGEKSELVEELKADVQDVKDMYRELVERTVK